MEIFFFSQVFSQKQTVIIFSEFLDHRFNFSRLLAKLRWVPVRNCEARGLREGSALAVLCADGGRPVARGVFTIGKKRDHGMV